MKLVLLIILLCGLDPTTNYTVKSMKVDVDHHKTSTANFEMFPSGLLFQF